MYTCIYIYIYIYINKFTETRPERQMGTQTGRG